MMSTDGETDSRTDRKNYAGHLPTE